tara:strand:- start:22 stop:315 length:294 start_codon:yes stop_codon:yes gene_type:complete
MKNGLNWKEQMHWELYKQYLSYRYEPIHECYAQSKLATDQFINNLAADAREELESTGWEEQNFKAMLDSYKDQWDSQRNCDCYDAVERALSQRPLNH